MTDLLTVVVVTVGAALIPAGPWLARRFEWRDEGEGSSGLSRALGLGAGRGWRLYRLFIVKLVGIGFVVAGLLALLGVWDVSQ